MIHDTNDLNRTGWTYKLKHVFCHDPGCWTCAQGKGHGPYWHASFEKEGKTHTVFLGKEFKPVDLKDQPAQSQTPPKQSKTSPDQKTAANSAKNRFQFKPEKGPMPQVTDKKPFPQKNNDQQTTYEQALPPTRIDFERDLNALKNTFQADSLKSVYRKLTKKYHPDKYPGLGYINTWMAEINGQYTQKKKSIRLY